MESLSQNLESGLVLNLQLSNTASTVCPIGTHDLFEQLSTPFINHYCFCGEQIEDKTLNLDYFTIDTTKELDVKDLCGASSCEIRGGALVRQRPMLNLIHNNKVCVKTTSINDILSSSSIDYSLVAKPDNCSQDFVPCGWLNPQSYLCAKESFKCPLNSLKLLEKDTIFSKKYFSIKMNDSVSLFYSKQETNNYLVTTDVSFGFEEICLDPTQKRFNLELGKNWIHWDSNFVDKCSSVYWENNKEQKIYTDPRYKEIGKINLKTLFKDNKVDTYMAENNHSSFFITEGLDYDISIFFRYSINFNR